MRTRVTEKALVFPLECPGSLTALPTSQNIFFLLFLTLIISGSTAGAASAEEGQGRPLSVPAGERIVARLGQTLSTAESQVGQYLKLTSASTLFLGLQSRLSLRPGATFRARVTEVQLRKRPFRSPSIKFEIEQLETDKGPPIPIKAEVIRVVGGGIQAGAHLLLPKGTYIEFVLNRSLVLPTSTDLLEPWLPELGLQEVPPGSKQEQIQDDLVVPEPEQQSSAFQVKAVVDRVLVEAVVRHKNGSVLEGLTKEDFRLREEGREQEILEFAPDYRPLALVLLIDCSASIEPFRDELRRAASQTLGYLGSKDRVAVIGFDETTWVIQDLSTDKSKVSEKISAVKSEGRTDIYKGIQEACFYLHRLAPALAHSIVMISDNWATEPEGASEGSTVRMALETDSVVYSLKLPGSSRLPKINFYSRPVWMGDAHLVQRLVEATGGEIIEVKKKGHVEASLREIILSLKRRYAMGYQSNRHFGPGFRRIELELTPRFGKKGEDYFVHVRSGYYTID